MANSAAVGLTYQLILTAISTITGEFISTSDPTISQAIADELATLNSGTTPPITKVASGSTPLSSGALTLDLTALTNLTGDGTIDFTGLKIQFAFWGNKATNANPMTVAKGASNGYGLSAAGTTFSVPMDPDSCFFRRIKDTAPDVDSTHKTFDITGTGAQVLRWFFLAG